MICNQLETIEKSYRLQQSIYVFTLYFPDAKKLTLASKLVHNSQTLYLFRKYEKINFYFFYDLSKKFTKLFNLLKIKEIFFTQIINYSFIF